ncbi:MAG: sensor histidine kinase [Acidimicrobiales bacterium]
MTRRKAFVLLLASLVVVYVVGGVLGVVTTRARLLSDIDDRLHFSAATIDALQTELPFDLEELAAERVDDRAFIVVGPDGDIEFERMPGPGVDRLGRPDLSGAEIVARQGEIFTVPGIGVDHGFRVLVFEDFQDGKLLAIAQPLGELREAVTTLTQVLLVTLLGVVALLGLMFWWLARLAFGPYDQIVDTADAIVEGHLDRRVSSDRPDPDVQRLVGAINRMLDQNQEALAARTEAEERVMGFAAEASHELRTPLATIAGYSEVYLSGASTDPDSVHKQMSRINGEATRLGRLVESMLTITRLDNEVGFESSAIDLVEVARAAVADAAFGSPDPETATRLSLDEGDLGSLIVDGDRDSLYQVFANLLTNALVHAPGAEVAVTLAALDGEAVITVADDGPGMPKLVAEKAFDRFYRGSPTSDSGLRTTGLGLSISAGIVNVFGGTIDLVTTQGEGTAVTIRLPLATS